MVLYKLGTWHTLISYFVIWPFLKQQMRDIVCASAVTLLLGIFFLVIMYFGNYL